VTITTKYGISQQIIAQGISEIIEGKETPTVDSTLQQIQQLQMQLAQQEAALKQQAIVKGTQLNVQQAQAENRDAIQVAQPTGDETYGEQPAQPAQPTGDETYSAE
jgi:hypothetical protein